MNTKMTDEQMKVIERNKEFLAFASKDILDRVKGKTDVMEIMKDLIVALSSIFLIGYASGEKDAGLKQRQNTIN